MKSVCEHMMTSKQIQNLLSLLLAVGNFLNGCKKECYQERSMDCVTRSISHYKDDDSSQSCVQFLQIDNKYC